MGLQATLTEVRQKWWITKGRATVEKCLEQCIICKIYQGKQCAPLNTPPLPAFKGKPCKPFEIVGLDYFGPIPVRLERNEKTAIKRSVCIFTCIVTRNIHLEVAHNMTTTSFLNSSRGFTALRSQPRIIYSDSATQFKAASKLLIME